MAFAQLAFKDSLRDIQTCLRAMKSKLYHAGFRGHIAKSTLADANEKRPWQIYADFARLYTFTKSMAFFVTRAKTNIDYTRISYRTVDKTTGLRSDQTITLQGQRTSQDYPVPMRRISYYDKDTNKRLVFLTNNFTLDALIIAKLYKCRWKIELFFKWLKQNLHIKAFFGTSDNAVKTQIWIAVNVYVLIAIIKKELRLGHSLAEILQILSIALFEQVPIQQILTEIPMKTENSQYYNQLSLFNL
jgi:IS4 transposase